MKLSSKYTTIFVIAVSLAISGLLYFNKQPVSPARNEESLPRIGSIASFDTATGLKVMYLYAPELPMVDLQLLVDAGSIHDGPQRGVAALTNSLLDRGTKEHDADSFADKLAAVGAVISQNIAKDYASVNLRTLTQPENFTPALDLYLAMLAAPAFDDQSFELRQAQQLTAIKYEQQQPASMASRAFYKLLYPNHPYGRSTSGAVKTVQALKPKDVREFYANHYGTAQAVLAIVGNITEQNAKNVAEQVGKVLADHKNRDARLAVPQPVKDSTKKLNFSSEQTHIYYGALGVKRGDPDYFPLYVGNYILGGGDLSRLYKGIRDNEGLAYSVYSYFHPSRQLGPFVIGMQTRNEKREKALISAKEILQRFITDGPSEAELIAAKKYITGNFPLRVQSNSDMVTYLAVIGYYDLPLSYLLEFNNNIENVTVAAIKDAFSRRVDPKNMVTVMVGKIHAS